MSALQAQSTRAAPVGTDTVIERYKDMVYAICLTHTQNRGDAEDAFQEVFLTYHRKQPDCRDEDHRQAWLITTTLNVARRLSTSSWRTRVVPLHPDFQPALGTIRFDEPTYDELFAALQELPEKYRTVIHLFYFEDLPIARIAAVLNLQAAAVKMRLSRGRAMLREIMSRKD